jgi:hypothetical protein
MAAVVKVDSGGGSAHRLSASKLLQGGLRCLCCVLHDTAFRGSSTQRSTCPRPGRRGGREPGRPSWWLAGRGGREGVEERRAANHYIVRIK